ncbi:hypothetical protein AB0F17_61985 [Nonomuraea sp. NPDC026600]|uniref:hypothetical protein n=1 Tax=Nonomuraea sp. NPDC026600 TaxID=3155363 RepID=UPI0033CE6FAF
MSVSAGRGDQLHHDPSHRQWLSSRSSTPKKPAPRTISSVLADGPLRALLDRHPLLPQDQQSFAASATHRRAVAASASGDFLEEWRDVAIRYEAPVTAEDVTDALTVYSAATSMATNAN